MTVEADKATTLRVKYVLFTRPTMFKLQENGTITTMREQAIAAGFRKLIIWDGYKFTWTWDLAKG